MKKRIFLAVICVLFCILFAFFKANKREFIVEPIVLDNAAHMKLDLKTLEKIRQNNVLLPQPIQEKKAIKPIHNSQATVETKSSILVVQELLWQEDENIKEDDEEGKSSFLRWFRQKLYGVKIELKLPF